jgi:hypothetical protein
VVNLRRTIYLTIMSSLDFEEAGHKLMKITLRPGQVGLCVCVAWVEVAQGVRMERGGVLCCVRSDVCVWGGGPLLPCREAHGVLHYLHYHHAQLGL